MAWEMMRVVPVLLEKSRIFGTVFWVSRRDSLVENAGSTGDGARRVHHHNTSTALLRCATYLGVQVHVSALEGLEGVVPEAGAAAPPLQRTIMLQVRYISVVTSYEYSPPDMSRDVSGG